MGWTEWANSDFLAYLDQEAKRLQCVQQEPGYRELKTLLQSVMLCGQIRPYTPESTGSRPISEVKLVMAQSVLWWGTTREYCVLYLFLHFAFSCWPPGPKYIMVA